MHIYLSKFLNCRPTGCVYGGSAYVFLWGACVCLVCVCVCVEGVSGKIIFSGDCWSRSHVCLVCVCCSGACVIMCASL